MWLLQSCTKYLRNRLSYVSLFILFLSFQDAVKLQKIMQDKVTELLDIDQVTQRVTNKTKKVRCFRAFHLH